MSDRLTGPPPFITFYSFKGGVGRTMALANVACILAGRGRRVLCMDVDLEAPGLTYLAAREQKAVSQTPGLVDMIFDLLEKGAKAPIANKSEPLAFLEYTHELPIPKHARQEKGGRLVIMPAGKMDERYEDRLRHIDLGSLYKKGKGKPILKHIRNLIAQSGQFDYVLIDSRTGFSDEAGVCVRDLADSLVILLGLNRQNIEGTVRFLKRMKRSRVKPRDVEFVATPVPAGEDELRGKRLKLAERELGKAWPNQVKLKVLIPYHPRLALDEEPFIFQWSETDLYRAYARLEAAVRAMANDTADHWMEKAQTAIHDGKHSLALDGLKELRKLDRQLAMLVLDAVTRDNVGNRNFTPYFDMLSAEAGSDPDAMCLHARHLIETDNPGQGVRLVAKARHQYARKGQRDEVAFCDFLLGTGLAKKRTTWKRAERHFLASLASNRRRKKREGIAGNLRALGELRLEKGDERKGVRNLKEAAEILRSLNNQREAGRVMRATAQYYERKGDLSRALALYDESLRAFQELGRAGRGDGASVKHSMARIHRLRGDHDQALALFQESLKVDEELGDRRGAAVTKHAIAEIHSLRGDYDQALALYQESLKVDEELGDRRGAAVTKHAIAEIHSLRGDYDQALALYQESLKVMEELGDRRGAAVTKHAIAEIHSLRGDYDQALALFQESLKVDEELGDRRGAAVTRGSIADIHRLRGDYDQALSLYQESLKVQEELGDRRGAAVTKSSIADILRLRGDYDQALALYQESLKVKEELGDRHGAAVTKHSLADILRLRGDYDQALDLYQESLEVKEELGDQRNAAVTRAYLGLTLGLLSRKPEATALLKQAVADLSRLADPEALARARIHQARLSGLTGGRAAARTRLDQARRLAVRIGAQHLLADIAVLRAQFCPEDLPARRRGLQAALQYYRRQSISTEEAKAAEEMLECLST